MKALILIGSLKPELAESNTQKLASLFAKELQTYNVKHDIDVEMVYLADWNISIGVSFKSDSPDEMGQLFRKINESDMLIMATPIWWGGNKLAHSKNYGKNGCI
jgi:multimeric flavodoxin WrbA